MTTCYTFHNKSHSVIIIVILDREHALRNAEKAKRPDVERTDYLFDRINADNRKLVLEIPTPVQIQQPETNHIQAWIFAMATMAAVFSLVAMILALF